MQLQFQHFPNYLFMQLQFFFAGINSTKVSSAISKLKTGKSPDSNGIRAEDIKACDDETREMMRELFNEIIKRNNFHN